MDPDRIDPAAFIRRAFPSATETSRQTLLAEAELRTYPQEAVIVRQGEPSCIAILMDGHVGLYRTADDGRQILVNVAKSGDIAILTGISGHAVLGDLVAIHPSTLLFWTGGQVRALAMLDPGLALDCVDDAVKWTAGFVNRLDDLHSQDAKRRVARILIRFESLFFGADVVLTSRELPALVGTSREMTGRVLRELEHAGVVRRESGGQLMLIDDGALRRLAVGELAGRTQRAACQ